MPEDRRNKEAKLIVIFAMILHVILGIMAINRDNITADELDHLNYGVSILKGEAGRRDTAQDFTSTMPVSMFNALPRALEQLINPALQKSDYGKEDTIRGRYVSLIFSLLLLAYVYLFTLQFATPWAASLITLLAAADPNFLTHGHLVTTDIYAALAFVATIYHLYQWTINNKRKHFYFWCIAISIAQCCKMNSLVLYPISMLIILAVMYKKRQWIFSFRELSLFIFFQLMIINAAFLFEGTGTLLSEAQFSSQRIKQMVEGRSIDIPLPVPLAYLDGFDRTFLEIETGKGLYLNYFLGELKSAEGFPAYFSVCWNLKTPLLTLGLIYSALLTLLVRFRKYKKEILFLVVPAACVFTMISFAAVQNGYRYAIPATAILMPLISIVLEKFRPIPYAGLVISTLGIAQTLVWAPDFIPYTNAIVLDKTKAYQYFADSNLNWGQNDERVNEWIKNHPGSKLNPRHITTGTVVVDINKLVGADPGIDYAWLRENHQPVNRLWHSHLIYDVK